MLMLIFFLTNAYNLQRKTANITPFEFCYCLTENYYYQCILPITHNLLDQSLADSFFSFLLQKSTFQSCKPCRCKHLLKGRSMGKPRSFFSTNIGS